LNEEWRKAASSKRDTMLNGGMELALPVDFCGIGVESAAVKATAATRTFACPPKISKIRNVLNAKMTSCISVRAQLRSKEYVQMILRY
jgi:hypothetical protein